MKAILLCRPGDFGILEELWPLHPLTLPVLGLPLYRHFGQLLSGLGIREVRVLQGGEASLPANALELELRLGREQTDLEWSFRSWHLGPFPSGQSLPEILQMQRLFQDSDDLLVLSAPILPLLQLTGPKLPPAFPVSQSHLLAPRLLSSQGLLAQHDLGPCASLAGPLEFHRTILRLLTTLPPPAPSLKGVHRRARLEAPVWLGSGIKVDADAQVGPEVVLAPRARVATGAQLRSTLVLTPSHLGKSLALQDKIVIGTSIINPVDGSVLDVTDKGLLHLPKRWLG